MFQGTGKRCNMPSTGSGLRRGSPAGQPGRGWLRGCSAVAIPFFGLQIVISVAAATVVRGNPPARRRGNPGEQSGHLRPALLVQLPGRGPSAAGISRQHRPGGHLHRSSLWDQGWEFTARIMLGSTLVGAVLALVSGLMAYRLFRRRSRAQTEAVLN